MLEIVNVFMTISELMADLSSVGGGMGLSSRSKSFADDDLRFVGRFAIALSELSACKELFFATGNNLGRVAYINIRLSDNIQMCQQLL